MFGEHRSTEFDAVLRVWTEMLNDEVLRRRCGIGLSPTTKPEWLGRLTELRPVRASVAGDVYGAEETLFVELALGEQVFTIAIPISLLGLPTLQSAYPLDAPIDVLLADLAAAADQTTSIADLSLADAGARTREALAMHDSTVPNPEIDDPDWPLHRPLLEWTLRLLPESGVGYERREWVPEELDALLAEFLSATPEVTADQALHDHARLLLEFNANYGCGDPLRWGPQVVEQILMDLYPRKVMADPEHLGSLPEALIMLIPWANGRAGLPEEATAQAVQALVHFVPAYLSLIAESAPSGALPDELRALFDEATGQPLDSFVANFAGSLIAEVGSLEELKALDTRPLPLEPLTLTGIQPEVHDRVRAVATLITDEGGKLFRNPELVTVASRILERLARIDPGSFRGRIKDTNLAAALCWLAAKNNQWFERDNPERTAKALMASFTTRTSPLERAEAMLHAMGEEFLPGSTAVMLGDPALLVSWRRQELIASRDELDQIMES
ncbi:hypothetical protein FM113_16075 [Leucobacter sp. 7(1)]|nr:hypothetical protein FM113_16075 [Leucobacter sp. 7(1)]